MKRAPNLGGRRGMLFGPLVLERLASAAAATLSMLTWGCDQDLSRDYELIVRVTSEPDRGVEGAQASRAGRALGASDDSGVISIRVRGREGDVLPIDIDCPTGFRSPPPVLVPLRHVGRDANGQRARPEFAATCTPSTRSVVVAIRADGGERLPVLHMGRELTRTDSSGAAHVRLEVSSEDVVQLVLDTSEQPRLRPKNPTLRIVPGAKDEITAISQPLTLQPRPPLEKAVPRRGPTRIE